MIARVRAWLAHPRAPLAISIAAIALGALLAYHHFSAVTAKQKAGLWHDSQTFLETARQPLDADHLFYPKPFVAPAFDRLCDAEPETIRDAQLALSFCAWLVLAVVLWATLRRWPARAAALLVCGAFVLAPSRVGFGSIVASESLDDTLRTLAIACAIGLAAARPRLRPVVAALLAIAAIAWILTRDTTAVVALVAIALAAWRTSVRAWWRARWPAAIAGVVAIFAMFAIASTQVIPRQPLGVALTDGWAPESTRRGAFALVDNFMIRVMKDPEGRASAIADGLPWRPELDHYIGTGAYGDFLSEDKYKPTRDWIYAHGTSTYLGWLARHPLDRIEEVVGLTWNILTPNDLGGYYMREGWRGNTYGGRVMRTYRGATESPVVVLALLIALPVLLVRARGHALARVAAIAAASAVVGIFAGYYGDAMEMVRHAWGASQQLVLALFLLAIAALDAKSATGTAPASATPSDTRT